jgi:signal transduction histidine kinase
MWTFPKRDLKLRLTLRIAAVSMLCLIAAAAYVVIDSNQAARARMARSAEIAAKGLALQHELQNWVKGLPMPFPDLQMVATPLLEPGLCIGLRAEGSSGEQQRFCGGTQSGDAPPTVFTVLYQALFDPGREIAQPILARGKAFGAVVISADPTALTAAAWAAAQHLITVMGATLILLCILVYAALARALRPTRLIQAGLERIAAHDLSARLPPFDLAELSAIRDVFNDLAADLERTLRERKALTEKLIDLQDEERRHLARELHDEFGQNLTAIRALAASIGQTAAAECPSLLPEADSVARTAGQMMEALRGTLFRLRPPDVDELGLAASLEGLIAGWNGRYRGRTRFEIGLTGPVETVPASVAASLYRIAQEALTNAAKHADATRVALMLLVRADEIRLSVENDGQETGHDATPGLGLLGMRERVAALGGGMTFGPRPEGGTILSVAIPVTAHLEQAA